MLVLSRKVGERVLLGDEIVVTVVQLAHGTVRLGFEAPRDLSIIREELKVGQGQLPEKRLPKELPTDSMPNEQPTSFKAS